MGPAALASAGRLLGWILAHFLLRDGGKGNARLEASRRRRMRRRGGGRETRRRRSSDAMEEPGFSGQSRQTAY